MKIRRAAPGVVLAGIVVAAMAAAQDRGVPPAVAPVSRLDRLSWLAGSWVADSGGVRSEEHWMAPRGGLMVGMNRRVANGRARGFEFLRIRERGDTIAYLANPGAGPMTAFPLVELGERRVVFENPTHDFPQRVIYWMEADGRLRARVEGTVRGQLVTEDYAWRKGGLDP